MEYTIGRRGELNGARQFDKPHGARPPQLDISLKYNCTNENRCPSLSQLPASSCRRRPPQNDRARADRRSTVSLRGTNPARTVVSACCVRLSSWPPWPDGRQRQLMPVPRLRVAGTRPCCHALFTLDWMGRRTRGSSRPVSRTDPVGRTQAASSRSVGEG